MPQGSFVQTESHLFSCTPRHSLFALQIHLVSIENFLLSQESDRKQNLLSIVWRVALWHGGDSVYAEPHLGLFDSVSNDHFCSHRLLICRVIDQLLVDCRCADTDWQHSVALLMLSPTLIYSSFLLITITLALARDG